MKSTGEAMGHGPNFGTAYLKAMKGGNKKLFEILNKKQLMDKHKAKYCDHIIKNEKNIKILKKNLLDILNTHE